MKILAFTGMPAAGKTEAVSIARNHNIPIIRMGDMVWGETERQGRPLDGTNVGYVANTMRKEHGNDIWARKTLERIQSQSEQPALLIIDGIRNTEEIHYFKENLSDDFIVIAITANDDLRLQRYLKRNRADDDVDEESFWKRDKREEGWGLRDVIAQADIVIQNEDDLENLTASITTLLEQFQTKV